MSRLTVSLLSAIAGALLVGLPLLVRAVIKSRHKRVIQLSAPAVGRTAAERAAERRRNWKDFLISLLASLVASAISFVIAFLFTGQERDLVRTPVWPATSESTTVTESHPEAETSVSRLGSQSITKLESNSEPEATLEEPDEAEAALPGNTPTVAIPPIMTSPGATRIEIGLQEETGLQDAHGTQARVLVGGATTSSPWLLSFRPALDENHHETRILAGQAATAFVIHMADLLELENRQVPKPRILVSSALTTKLIDFTVPLEVQLVADARRVLIESAESTWVGRVEPPNLEDLGN